jgi:eukaryotic-like serine/threonine-protein kinase
VTAKSGGKYRILAHLRGGDATESSLVSIENGTSATSGGLAVVKRLKLGADTEPEVMERFKNEAILCKLFDHPNLAKLYEAGMDDGAPVLVFEYVEGVSLARLRSRSVREGGAMPKAIALRIVAGIAQGLMHLHGLKDASGKPLQVVHRDVSPENVIVTYDGEVKIVDFGMATMASAAAQSRANRVKGNVAYMAPEQAKADYKLDARADIFALGVILWELLTGKRFWEGKSEVEVLAKLGDDSPMPGPRTVVAALPEPLDKLTSDAIHKVRDERIESVEQFIEQFKDVGKKTGMKATAEEVGEFVTSLFEDERQKMRAIIEEARLEAAGGEKKPLAVVGPPPTSSGSSLVDKESDPRLRFGIAPADQQPAKRIIEVIVAETPPSADRRFGYMMAAAAVAVLGGIAIFAFTHPGEEKKVEEKPYEPPVRPTATTPPAVSTEVNEPSEVSIEVRVTPPQAKLVVDGIEKPNPFITRVVPAKFQHAIRAEAEGFETRTMSVQFDKERSIEIALVPAKKKP